MPCTRRNQGRHLLSQPPSMPTCSCSVCYPGAEKTTRTIQRHLKSDQHLLNSQVHQPEVAAHYQRCIDRTLQVLWQEEQGTNYTNLHNTSNSSQKTLVS